MVDLGRLRSLLEYATDDGNVGVDDLVKVCLMFLDIENPNNELRESLNECCEEILGKISNEPINMTVNEVLNAISQPENSLYALLEEKIGMKELESGDGDADYDNKNGKIKNNGKRIKGFEKVGYESGEENGVKTSKNEVSNDDGVDAEDNLVDGNGEEEGDEEEEVEETDVTAEKAILRGIVKEVDGEMTWSGKWALSADKFKEGEKERFKYTFSQDVKTIDSLGNGNDKELTDQEVEISGSFMLKHADSPGGLIKIEEPSVKLTLTRSDYKGETMLDVTGFGVNDFGDFNLTGKYDPETGKMALEKTYKPKDVWAEDDGEEDEEGEFEDGNEEESEADDDIDQEGGGEDELAGLLDEATMPIEELRKRYYS